MIGMLPKSLNINDKEYAIRTDYRNILLVFEVMNDNELDDYLKMKVIISIIFKEDILIEDYATAYDKILWFINCGKPEPKYNVKKPVLYDWEKDEQFIFSAINKVAGQEIRSLEYMHWWTFMGLFNEIGEGMFSTIVSIRSKKLKRKKMDKWEIDFYRDNKDIVDLPKKHTPKEDSQLEELNRILGI